VPHSLVWGDTSRCGGGPHIVIRAAGGRADGAITSRSERKSYNTFHKSPTYITYAKGDDTVYSKAGGSLAESR
jgi:hypothetical protein